MKADAASVLVVDDTPANLALLLDALVGAGYRLLVAESGQSALAQLAHAKPDLILLDVVMPGMNGFETCARLKANPAWRDIPVLFMTALHEPDEKVRAFDAGAVDYITKPAYPPEVLARVGAHLRIRALQRSLEAQNAELESEIDLRIEAENQLSASLDRAVVVATADGRVTFCTRLATGLLFKYFADWRQVTLPRELHSVANTRTPFSTLEINRPNGGLNVRRFVEPGRDEIVILYLEEKNSPPTPASLIRLGLTAREAEVLYWIAQGKSNPDIATILGVAVRTVHKHVEHIFQKLGLETRASAALVAAEVLRQPA
jgi:DNA-binding response OmpR family regulator/DNA-binding CsgD family transcriptional regulator